MLRITLVLSLAPLACGALGNARAAVPALMPMPVKVGPGTGRLAIDGNFSVAATGYADERLDAALRRFVARISRQTGIPMAAAAGAGGATLRVDCAGAGQSWPSFGEDESYTLDVASGQATLKAATVDGALRGLETFLQLVGPGPDGFEAPAVHIEDRPRFPWRGFMLDVSRHWMPVEVVKRNLDAMAAVKLNVFHWHLSDDQGFRVESKIFPRLHEYGSGGHYYTQDQVREVLAYARDRGIRVVPEFDMPGHTTSWFPGYPDLASAPGPYQIAERYGVLDPCMDPSREHTYEFLDAFLGEMAALFPDPYFHIGGDEVNGKQWKASEAIQAFAKEHGFANTAAIQTYFSQRIQKLLEKHGKTMVGWDEILNPDLPTNSVIQSWRGQDSLAEAASKGYSGILSWGYYLDHLRPASYHYAVDPMAGKAAALDSAQASHILGGEACMWTEMADAETVDSRTWPRLAAIAERFWSPREVTDVNSMYARMEVVGRQLEWTGIEDRADYGPMLDRLAGAKPVEPVRALADAVEARGLGTGRSSRRYNTSTPLNRLVDAARPESESVRALEAAAGRVIANPAAAKADILYLREAFGRWAANDARFQQAAEGNSLLAEYKPLSADLSAVGTMGLQVLDYLETGKAAPADWLAEQAKTVARLQKPSDEVMLAACRPVKVLLDELARKSGAN
jgi:hexosaminidase